MYIYGLFIYFIWYEIKIVKMFKLFVYFSKFKDDIVIVNFLV